jgi:hypothetical protein
MMMMKGGYGYDRYDKKMMNKKQEGQRQMMGPNNQNQPLINDTPDAAGTFEAGAAANPNVPLEVQ